MSGGVYVYRTRKPASRLRVPFLSYHFAYVGETTSFHHRHMQHVVGGGQFRSEQKPWADLEPRVWLRIPLPPWKPLLRTVETLAILLTWPVYNVAKNRWNPRRIAPSLAAMHRRFRDRRAWYPHVTYAHMAVLLMMAALLAWLVTR